MENEIKYQLKKLISLPGISGFERPVGEAIQEIWQPLVDETDFSKLGSLHALKKGVSNKDPRPSILMAAHMDAIGLMVTKVVDGFIRFTSIGGIREHILPGQLVVVHGKEPMPGVVVKPADGLLPPEFANKVIPDEYLWVDVGLDAEEVNTLVKPGDVISFAQEPLELAGDTISGHSLDNRASVSALTVCLQVLKTMKHAWDVWAVATVMEEINFGGAKTSPMAIRPDIAVAVDVTFAKAPGTNDHDTVPLGKGVAIGWGPNLHPKLFENFKEIAERLDIPYSKEVMPAHSYTDAIPLQVSAEGIPTMLLSVPLRYMHNSVELVSIKDIQRTGYLLAQFIAGLDENYLETLVWDE